MSVYVFYRTQLPVAVKAHDVAGQILQLPACRRLFDVETGLVFKIAVVRRVGVAQRAFMHHLICSVKVSVLHFPVGIHYVRLVRAAFPLRYL